MPRVLFRYPTSCHVPVMAVICTSRFKLSAALPEILQQTGVSADTLAGCTGECLITKCTALGDVCGLGLQHESSGSGRQRVCVCVCLPLSLLTEGVRSPRSQSPCSDPMDGFSRLTCRCSTSTAHRLHNQEPVLCSTVFSIAAVGPLDIQLRQCARFSRLLLDLLR